MKRFEIMDHPSDVGIIAYGADLKDLFENAAYGMFSLMTDLKDVSIQNKFEVKAKGEDREELLVNWLNELIFLEDTHRVILKDFKISSITDTEISALAFGEKMEKGKHTVTRAVKAATFNRLEITGKKGYLIAKVVFDV